MRTLFTILFLVSATILSAQTMNYSLDIPIIHCSGTTDAPFGGEDEVYCLISYCKSDGTTGTLRAPAPTEHWNLNDTHNHNQVEPFALQRFTLNNGESIDFVVIFMEEDGGRPSDYSAFGNAITINYGVVGRFFQISAETLLKAIESFFDLKDTDDYIGSYGVHVVRNGNSYSTIFNPIDRVYELKKDTDGPNTMRIKMNGDGSDYYIYANISQR